MLHLWCCKWYAGCKKVEAHGTTSASSASEETPGGAISRSWRNGTQEEFRPPAAASVCEASGRTRFASFNLLSSALPFNVVARAPLFFGGYGGNLQPTPPRSPPQNPKPHGTAAKPTRSPPNPPYTAWESERNPHGAHWEPTGNPAGTCMAEREEPTRSPRKPTRNPPGTHPKPYLKQRRSPPTHWCLSYFLFGGKKMRWETSRLASIIQRLFL